MSVDAEDVMKRAECPVCELIVEDYAPGESSTIVGGVLMHPACAPMASAEYARCVHDLLTSGPTQTRPIGEHPLLSEAETDEMVEQFLLGVPAETFAAKLELRDIAFFEQSIDREVGSGGVLSSLSGSEGTVPQSRRPIGPTGREDSPHLASEMQNAPSVN